MYGLTLSCKSLFILFTLKDLGKLFEFRLQLNLELKDEIRFVIMVILRTCQANNEVINQKKSYLDCNGHFKDLLESGGKNQFILIYVHVSPELERRLANIQRPDQMINPISNLNCGVVGYFFSRNATPMINSPT